ncbi:MAG: ribonuclease HII, partial [Acidobacteria bacterium]
AGTDEAGVGPLAGPLVAAAVILPPRARLPGVDDSKRLTAPQREYWAERVRNCALAWSLVEVPPEEVDAIGPYAAALRAKAEAVRRLDPPPDYVLVDAHRLPDLGLPQEAVVGADGRFLAVAAASLLAKTHRDSLMLRLDRRYPGYGFARNKGYGTADHLAALGRLGPCPAHRRRYAPVRQALGLQPRLPV